MLVDVGKTLLVVVICVNLLISVALSISVSASPDGCGSGVLFYMYGASWCPHCQVMHSFFEANFAGRHYFCVVDKVEECATKFTALWDGLLRNETSARFAVPTTIVVKDNKSILAIVIGEVRDKDFWTNLSCLNASNEIPLYYGNKLYRRIPVDSSDHVELIKNYLVFTTTSDITTSQQSSGFVAIAVIFAAVILPVLGYALYTALKR